MDKKPLSASQKALDILLESSSHNASDVIVFEHIRDILSQSDAENIDTQHAYEKFINELLNQFEQNLSSNIEPLHLKLIKKRLSAPVSANELNSIRRFLPKLSLQSVDTPTKAPVPEEKIDRPSISADAVEHEPRTPVENEHPSPPTEDPESIKSQFSDRRVDITYRKHLDEKREHIQKIQSTLSYHVNEVIKQNEKFGVLLEIENDELQKTQNIEDLTQLKNALLNEVKKLLEGHNNLTVKLDNANKYLQIIETEGKHLNDELTRVHILSLTDELTNLPNRRAFLRRLDDEVARVQRYGYPLSLGIIDIDRFKMINDKLGHIAGDIVLESFSKNVLSTFRHHDLVARYGGEEFAVILPNTDVEGSLRALQKVKARGEKTTFEHNEKAQNLPTFSAGLALYKPGETPSSLIERADQALYRAKRNGRNRIELAASETQESKEEEDIKQPSDESS